MKYFIAHLRLMRPANIITAIADILLGFAASGAAVHFFNHQNQGEALPEIKVLGWLVLSTIGLYGGGVVFNDVFDAELDRVERPERPIPSGLATVTSAASLGAFLLLIGIAAAAMVSLTSCIIAIIIAGLAVFYDAYGKHLKIFGPLNMGLCRGANLLLGVSAVPVALTEVWYISLIPVVYIAAITIISRGEVHGSSKIILQSGLMLYVVVIAAILLIAWIRHEKNFQVIPFVFLFGVLIFPPLFMALKENTPRNIGKAVKAGVIALISMDAALASVFAGWTYCLLILALLPISFLLAKAFAVT